MTNFIERGTTIPTSAADLLTTPKDVRQSMDSHVLQANREMASYNKTFGSSNSSSCRRHHVGPPDRGHVEIDANGIVHVSAKDRATNKEQSMATGPRSSV